MAKGRKDKLDIVLRLSRYSDLIIYRYREARLRSRIRPTVLAVQYNDPQRYCSATIRADHDANRENQELPHRTTARDCLGFDDSTVRRRLP